MKNLFLSIAMLSIASVAQAGAVKPLKLKGSSIFKSCDYVATTGATAHYQVDKSIYVSANKITSCPTTLIYDVTGENDLEIYNLSAVSTVYGVCLYKQAGVGEVTCTLNSYGDGSLITPSTAPSTAQ